MFSREVSPWERFTISCTYAIMLSIMGDLEDLFQKPFQDINEMTTDELKEELRHLRILWSWITEDAKYYLVRIGGLCRIVTRYNKEFVGVFLQPHLTLGEFELEVVSKEYNYDDGEYYMERKIIRMPVKEISHIQFISERDLIEREASLTSVMSGDKIMSSGEEPEIT